MPISTSGTVIDERGYEIKEFGSPAFPAAVFDQDISRTDIPLHWHVEVEFVYVEEGQIEASDGLHRYIMEKGDGYFANTNCLHAVQAREQCRLRTVVFAPQLAGGDMNGTIWVKYIRPVINDKSMRFVILHEDIGWQSDVLKQVKKAWEACAYDGEGYELTVRESLARALFLLNKNAADHSAKADEKALRTEERMKEMLGYISDHFSQDITVDTLAKAAHISSSECQRCFKTFTGKSPIQYLRSIKLARAALILANSDEKINRIAASCGFNDISYFTKSFRETYGLSPKEYRREHGGG